MTFGGKKPDIPAPPPPEPLPGPAETEAAKEQERKRLRRRMAAGTTQLTGFLPEPVTGKKRLLGA